MQFYLGFLSAVVFLGVPYVLWRYVYVPWKVMRADLKNLYQSQEDFKARITTELGLRKAQSALTDEELARIEQRAKARKVWAVNE